MIKSITSKLTVKSQTLIIVAIGITIMMLLTSLFTTHVVNSQSRTLMLKNAIQIAEGLAKQSVFPVLSGSQTNAETAVEQVIGFETVEAVQILLADQSLFLSKSDSHSNESITISEPRKLNKLITAQLISEQAEYWLVAAPVRVVTKNEDDLLGIESEFSEDDLFTIDQKPLDSDNNHSSYLDNSYHLELITSLSNDSVPTKRNDMSAAELGFNVSNTSIIGYVLVRYSKVFLTQSQNQLTITIALIAVFSVIALCTLLYTVLFKLFKPLYKLAATMQQAQDTTAHTYASIEGAIEIRNMANAYNKMMAVLEQHEDNITSHRDQLEQEVETRTKELVQARDSALTASRHKSEFMANMSHELRTPIQSIIGYSELINEELELEGHFELVDDLDKVTNNAQRLLGMINSLLDLAKIEAGKHDINIIEVDVSQLKQDIQDVISPLAQHNNNQFEITIEHGITRLQTDKEKLEQVLINLLSNACKFTEQGSVALNIYSQMQHVYYEITDTGIGLSHEQQQYIFDEFVQVDGGQDRKFSGTGLGLAICKKFVQLMHGKISVKSEEGKGASFVVILPLNYIS